MNLVLVCAGHSASPQQTGDYSWSQDLVSRLNLHPEAGAAASPSARGSPAPSSAPALGSAPSTTLSEFSAVGRDLDTRPSAGKDNSLEQRSSRRSHGSHR